MRRRVTLPLLLPLLSLWACAAPRNVDVQDNPTPRQEYEVTLQIPQPPGPFDDVAHGWVRYRVSNDRCLPLTPIEGATLHPEKMVEFTVTRVNATIYRGALFADRLRDMDYRSLGVCHWAINTLAIELKGNGVVCRRDEWLRAVLEPARPHLLPHGRLPAQVRSRTRLRHDQPRALPRTVFLRHL